MRIRKDTEFMEEDEILIVSQISDALAHPARIKIYQFIMKCNTERRLVCNKDVVSNFNYSQATISQHLKKLVSADLLQIQKKDRYSYYYANIGMLMRYLNATKKFSTFKG